jgi:hypothetical protein
LLGKSMKLKINFMKKISIYALCLGIAWKGEDSKKRALKDQARVKGKQWLGHRWTMTMVNKRMLALKWEVALWGGSNHSWIWWKKWLDTINWTHMVGNGLSHMLKVVLLKENETKIVATLKCWRLQEMAHEDIEASSNVISHILLYLEYSMSYYYEWCNTNSLISLKCSN